MRGAIEALAEAMPLSLVEEGEWLRIGSGTASAVEITPADEGARTRREGGLTEIVRQAASAVPNEVSVAYHDAGRDYQTGLQRARLGTGPGRTESVGLPAVLTAGAAKAMAENKLAALLAGRMTAATHLPPRCLSIAPGAHVRLPGQPGLWRVRRRSIGEGALVSLELVRAAAGSLSGDASADPGRLRAEPDLRHGPTTLFLLDLPIDAAPPAERLQLLAITAGAEPGWRRASLSASFEGGASWSPAGTTAGPAVMGHARSVLGAAGSALLDMKGSVEVELLNEEMWLEGRSDDALANGANLAVLGEELIQFGDALALGGRRFRLSRLLRGRRGSEWAAALHQPGEPFALLTAETIKAVEPPAGMLGGEARLIAQGIGDPEAVRATRVITGEALRPPAPAHLRAERRANGDIAVHWARRSRSGWDWPSGVDTPLGEERELYRIDLWGSGFARGMTVAEPGCVYTAAEQAEDGFAGTVHIEVTQIGTAAASRPAALVFSGDNEP